MKNSPDLFSESSDAEQHGRNRRLGWFVTGAVLIVIAAMTFMLVQKGLFKRTAQLHFFADSAKGMAPGMAVKLNGFKVGTLDKLVMDMDGRVSAMLLVGDEYVHLIHKDARARWAKEDLIGESVIEILSGSENTPTVENNALIAFERTRDVSEELNKLAGQLQPILADVKSITAYVDSPDGDLKKTVQQLKRATSALANAGEDVSDITRSNKKQIHSAITNASNTLSNLNASLPPLIKRVDASLQNVEGATADAHAISSKLVTDLPPAVSEGRETLEDTHEVVNAVKESWPINKLLPPQDEHPLPLDSHVPYGH
jgi:phospholipid/cholesterol/gamma-HCH transport system substrate-binding protein